MRRVGETRTRRVEARFISATNKDLEREVEAARFREDLYYRLKIIVVEVPPLRERRDDFLALLHRFGESYATAMGRRRVEFSVRAVDLMCAYGWPGNVRELQNEIQRALILCGEDGVVRPEHLSPKLNPQREAGDSPAGESFAEAKAEFVRRFLHQALRRCDYNKARTAEQLGLSRQGLFKLLKKHRVDRERNGAE
jgi:DNA-binding NtrC family response regulator